MRPFDDTLPEEQETRQKELIELLQKAARPPLTDGSPEETQTITHVQQRLAEMKGAILSPEDAKGLLKDQATRPFENERGQIGAIRAFPLNSPDTTLRQARRGARLLNALAAVLVVGLLIGGSLLLFRHVPQTPVSQSGGTSVTISGESGGLSMSISITPGPYFLSEMLAVDITLTNNTQNTYYVGAPFGMSACGYWSGILVSGSNGDQKPEFDIPIPTDHRCPSNAGRLLPLHPGSTLTAHAYVPLTNSGKQTLKGAVGIAELTSDGYHHYKPDNQFSWPSIQINVSSQVPADRHLSFKMKGSQVFVTSPTGVPAHLVYLYDVWCKDFNNDGGGTGTGNYGWVPMAINTEREPGCPGKDIHWDFAFGAPGYGIVMGNYIG